MVRVRQGTRVLGSDSAGFRRSFVCFSGAAAVVAAVAARQHPGSVPPYLLFNLAAVFVFAAALVRPRSHGYNVLAAFLLLGFWLKLVTFALGVPSIVEPIGDFSGEKGAWDEALTTAAIGLFGAALGKLAWAIVVAPVSESRLTTVPSWFAAGRIWAWAATAALIVAAGLANWVYGFYQIGVNARLILPMHLNVPIIWWLTAASAMWLAVLIEWERRLDPNRHLSWLFLVPVVEGLFTTVVMLSRAFLLMRVLPYAVALASRESRREFRVSRAAAAGLLAASAAAFLISVAAVSGLRLSIYPLFSGQRPVRVTSLSRTGQAATQANSAPPAGQPGSSSGGVAEAAPQLRRRMATIADVKETGRAVSRMTVGRWIGLEGVLTVSAARERSPDLLLRGLTEDPRLGNGAIYQQLSRATYRPIPGFTFLTVPGVVAVLAYSASDWIVLCGMSLIVVALLVTEEAYRRLFGNEMLCAVVGVGVANAICQMNFPYLTGIYLVEMWGSLAVLWVLTSFAPRRVRIERSVARPVSE
jgi:hypothetical protein